jgi:hypothetical protein
MDASSVRTRLLHSVPPFLRRHQVPLPDPHPYPPVRCASLMFCACVHYLVPSYWRIFFFFFFQKPLGR